MTVLLGCSPHRHNLGGIHLAGLLARSLGTDLVAVAVVEPPWEPRKARPATVGEHAQRLVADTRQALTAELEVLEDDLPVRTDVRLFRSTSQALVEAAAEHGARMIVLGSSTSGALGRVALGGVPERLLHSSPVPVALAPRGFTTAPDARVGRVTAAFAVSPAESALATSAAAVASELSAPLRLVSFAVHQRPPASTSLGPRAEDPVLDVWTEQATATYSQLAAAVRALPDPPELEDPGFGFATSWPAALGAIPWTAGEVLVVGSSRTTAARVVFLGGTASKISRNAPVPVIVTPRGSQGAPSRP